VWDEEDHDAISEMMSESITVYGLEEDELNGTDEVRMFHVMILSLLSEIKISIKRIVEDGDWIAARLTLAAKARNGPQDVNLSSQVMMRCVDDKIVEMYNSVDWFTAVMQLGLAPERALNRCLLGQRLVFPH
jgi:predicted ester cyclase